MAGRQTTDGGTSQWQKLGNALIGGTDFQIKDAVIGTVPFASVFAARGHQARRQETRNMGRKLYVGNLVYDANDSDLEQLFGQFGTVTSVQIIQDRMTGRSKGFGFVEMASDDEAEAAIDGLNGSDYGGRSLTVNEARPREDRGPGGGGGGRGGFGGGRGGGGGGRGGYGGGR